MSAVSKLPKPNTLRRPLQTALKFHIPFACGLALTCGLALKFLWADKRKEKILEFYRNETIRLFEEEKKWAAQEPIPNSPTFNAYSSTDHDELYNFYRNARIEQAREAMKAGNTPADWKKYEEEFYH